MTLSDVFYNVIFRFLKFCYQNILFYCLPTNPISTAIYAGIVYYGYRKLKTRVTLNLKRVSNRLLVYLYSLCFLGFINFCLENVWLTAFYLRYTFFNDGWLPQIYFDDPIIIGWIVNYLRNFIYLGTCFILSRDVWQHVNFNKKTIIGFLSVSLYIFLFFFYTPHYANIDWTYSLIYDFPIPTVIGAFMIGIVGKPLLFYTFYTIWQLNGKTTKKT